MAEGKLPIKAKLCYGLTDFGFSIAYTIPSFFLLIFLTDIVRMPPALAGTLLLICKIWDAVIDPFIGFFSDRVKTRWGRRRPFLFWFALPFGLSFSLIWFIPHTGALFWQGLLVLGSQIFFISSFSLLSVPYTSLAPEMTRDYDERTRLNAYRMFFSIIGGLVAVILPSYFLGLSSDLASGYRMMGICFGIFLIFLPLIAFFGTREETYHGDQEIGFLAGIRLVLSNRPFILALVTYLTTWVAIDVVSAIFLYFLKYWMGIGEEKSNTVFAVIFITAALCLPFWVKISGRFGKREAYFSGLGFLAVILLGLVMLQPAHRPFIYLIAALAGIGVSAAHVIPISIIPDTIEYDELQSGRRQEGVYFGIVTFLQQLASSAALFITGVVLQWTGYVAGAAQTTSALWGIRLLLGFFPGFLILLGILALKKYPIDRAYHARMKNELAERRSARLGG